MAKTIDINAAKQRKQKIILAVLGVVLLAVAAIQVPKLLGGSSPAPAAANAATDATGITGTTGTVAGSTTTTTPVPAGVPRAVLVGVTVGSAGRAPAGEGQLRSFTLFTAKDPFVQSLPAETSGSSTSTGAPTLSDTQPGSGGSQGSGDSSSAPTPGAPLFATISVNGKDVSLEAKDLFPPKQKLFVLVSLNRKTAKIAVAGGAFTDAQTITLRLGQNLTLVNTATGARYALKLLFVGDEPEQVEGFTRGAAPKK
jgi:hypothetical protein